MSRDGILTETLLSGNKENRKKKKDRQNKGRLVTSWILCEQTISSLTANMYYSSIKGRMVLKGS
jgi:hypothetical protein